jgi:uncharacterized protein (DUF1499 family)
LLEIFHRFLLSIIDVINMIEHPMTTMIKLSVGIFLLACASETLAYTNPKASKQSVHRRAFLSTALVVPALLTSAAPSFAFENRLNDRNLNGTPQTGRQPANIGVNTRTSATQKKDYEGLAPCDGRPNCWCSSTPKQDNPARYLAPWDANGSSIQDLKQVIDTYEVGQQGIDGGGFKVIEYDENAQYLYVQFQSYKSGYIDDAEFWFNPEKKQFDVRSASRLGMSDLGVNAKRLEYVGGRLEKEFGWKLQRRKSGLLV